MGRVGRGIFKKSKHWFKPGNKATRRSFNGPHLKRDPTKYLRPTHEQMEQSTTRDKRGFFCQVPSTETPTKTVMLLRPRIGRSAPDDSRLQPKSKDDHQPVRYRLADLITVIDFSVQAALDHKRTQPECDGQPKLVGDPDAEVCGNEMPDVGLHCHKCGFQTGNKLPGGSTPEGQEVTDGHALNRN